MTINLEGSLSSEIIKKFRISKGKAEHTCCVCHQFIKEKKMKVLADLQFHSADWRISGVKQFFFCNPCFQGFRVYQCRSMHEVEAKVGPKRVVNYEIEGRRLSHGDLVRPTKDFDVYVDANGHPTAKRKYGIAANDVPRIGLIVIGATEDGEYMWLYHPDHGPIQVWMESFRQHFVRVK